MPNKVPCPNDACEDGVIPIDNKEDSHIAPVKTQCPKCSGTGWIIPSDQESTQDE